MARQKVSERTFIDPQGNEVERIELATGARYTLAGISKSFDAQIGPAGKLPTMFGIFGFWTKVGNVANTVLNDKDEPGSQEDAGAEIESFLASVQGGVWRELSEGVARGPKYDNAILAGVLVVALGKAAKGDAAHYYERLESDKGYRAKVVARDDIKGAYWTEAAKRGITKTPPASAESLA